MKKLKVLIILNFLIFTIFGLIAPSSVSADTATFANNFPDQNLARVMAQKCNKQIDDSISQSDIDGMYNIGIFDDEGISDLTGIELFIKTEAIVIYDNPIHTIPDEISDINNLSTLMIVNGELTSIPQSISQISTLDFISLTGNHLTNLPQSLENLPIYNLDLDNNNLQTFTLSLPSLIYLGLSNNNFVEVPESLGDSLQLSYINMGGNKITSIPSSLQNIDNYSQINLGGNDLNTLPLGIENLKNFSGIDLSENKFTEIDSRLLDETLFSNLNVVNLYDNLITYLPPINRLSGALQINVTANNVYTHIETPEFYATMFQTYTSPTKTIVKQAENSAVVIDWPETVEPVLKQYYDEYGEFLKTEWTVTKPDLTQEVFPIMPGDSLDNINTVLSEGVGLYEVEIEVAYIPQRALPSAFIGGSVYTMPFDISVASDPPVDTYTVTFDSKGGTLVPQQTGIVAGGLAIEPVPPTRIGYTFVGWYKDNKAWNFMSDTVNSNITLVANWEKNDDSINPPNKPEKPGNSGGTNIPDKNIKTLPQTGDGNRPTAMMLLFTGLAISGGFMVVRKRT